MSSGILFQVETARVLQILAREIYDSPLAMIRENLQNAYDAVRMRFAGAGKLKDGGTIEIEVRSGEIWISDNGIGMSEEVLRENFWKAGSSGKHSEAARNAGVVGTFGIGAMANFGVCTRLTVETRPEGSSEVLRSVADRSSLKIAEECITLARITSNRDVGTTITAALDDEHLLTLDQVRLYIQPYVALLPVPVFLNGEMLSRNSPESQMRLDGRQFKNLGSVSLQDGFCSGSFSVRADQNGQVLVYVSDVHLGGNATAGEMVLLQSGGPLMGFRSSFGLAPVPAAGAYQFGGIADLAFLQPTAGREALTRESIEQVTRLIGLSEKAASTLLAETEFADRNNGFLQWVIQNNKYELASKVHIRVLPEDKEVALGDLKRHIGNRSAHYYLGTDQQIVSTFAGEGACLAHLVQVNPRRQVQLYYLIYYIRMPQVPDSVTVTREYKTKELTSGEVAVLLRTAMILREDYLLPDAEPVLADISHSVAVYGQKNGEQLKLFIARSSPSLQPLLALHQKAYELFTQFMKDFVRIQVFPRIQQFVPSSTRDGVDALRKILERNRELYRYEETEMGDFEGIFGEYLAGNRTLAQVIEQAHTRYKPQTQTVASHQVGSVEHEVPGVVDSPFSQPKAEGMEFMALPPIVRDSVFSDKKILTTQTKYPQLNNFSMLLGLSDRLFRTESDFFRTPHTTRILWGGHRVVYIFTEMTGRLSLYYDIELRKPIRSVKTGGGMFPTTTLITKNRIFAPVPDTLAEEFKIADGPKEFFVRFDILTSPPG